jgi:hypothetical protein
MEKEWIKLVDKYWHAMSEETRKDTFEALVSHSDFLDMIEHEEVKLFHARFDPDNQFTVNTNYKGTVNKMRAFKWKDRYYVGSRASVNDEYITSVEKITDVKRDKNA